jgi:hypothetical protein
MPYNLSFFHVWCSDILRVRFLLIPVVQETMVRGARQELQRSEKLASVNPQRYFATANATALLQYLQAELASAQETLHSIRALMDKVIYFPIVPPCSHGSTSLSTQVAVGHILSFAILDGRWGIQ